MTHSPQPAAPRRQPRTASEPGTDTRLRLERLIARSRLAMGWERLWPALWPPLGVCLLFIAVSWLGLWQHLPSLGRAIGCGLFGLAALASLVPLLRLRLPRRAEALRRLDGDAAATHRPATTLDDSLALGAGDPAAKALWALHQRRARAELERLDVAPPRTNMPARDPYALRAFAIVALVASAFVAGPDKRQRLDEAFDWRGLPITGSDSRLDGWIDPPLYTRLPPLTLDLKSASGSPAHVRVPVNSTLVLRASGGDLQVTTDGSITALPPPKTDGGASKALAAKAGARAKDSGATASPQNEQRFTITGNGQITVSAGRLGGDILIEAIPDAPPKIAFVGEPKANARGSLSIAYAARDDYGIATAEGIVTSAPQDERESDAPAQNSGQASGRTLVPPPAITLPPPTNVDAEAIEAPPPVAASGVGRQASPRPGDSRSSDGDITGGRPQEQDAAARPAAAEKPSLNAPEHKTTVDLSSHPWAGARVRMTLVARDEAGQEGRSETLTLTLPQRPFTNPLSRALVEQRRNLVLQPDDRARVQTALDALTIAPELFTPNSGVYLGLQFAGTQLRQAKSDAALIGVADYLWQMAIQIEDGDLSDAESALRAAQDAVREGLERGASDEEMRKLTENLRQALDRFVNEFAQQQRRNPNGAQAQANPNARTITPDELKNMLNRIEELSRQGATAEAQRLLEELRGILENLRTAQPGQSGGRQSEMNRSLDEIDQLRREQQALRDETYRDGQGRSPRGQQQGRPSQQGQRQQGQRQQGQEGQQGQSGQQGRPQTGEGGSSGSLSERQQALRQRLQDLQQRLKGLGAESEQGLEDAEGEMRDAEGSLGRGEPGAAVDSQGRALEALNQGAQELAKQMQGQGEEGQQGDGSQGAQAQGGEETDPLGRPMRSRNWSDGRVKVPNGADAAVARARRILDELRRRLGDTERPREELDYFERLLRPR